MDSHMRRIKVPSFFSRSVRPLAQRVFWKATEMRVRWYVWSEVFYFFAELSLVLHAGGHVWFAAGRSLSPCPPWVVSVVDFNIILPFAGERAPRPASDNGVARFARRHLRYALDTAHIH